jgi:cell division protein FtsL
MPGAQSLEPRALGSGLSLSVLSLELLDDLVRLRFFCLRSCLIAAFFAAITFAFFSFSTRFLIRSLTHVVSAEVSLSWSAMH